MNIDKDGDDALLDEVVKRVSVRPMRLYAKGKELAVNSTVEWLKENLPHREDNQEFIQRYLEHMTGKPVMERISFGKESIKGCPPNLRTNAHGCQECKYSIGIENRDRLLCAKYTYEVGRTDFCDAFEMISGD